MTNFAIFKGRGVQAQVNGRGHYVGGPRILEMLDVVLDGEVTKFDQRAGQKGQKVVYLVADRSVLAAFALADVARPERKEAVRWLQEMGLEVAMLTGDSQEVAAAVAEELGIQTYFAEVLLEHKDQKVAELQSQGKRVVMVGDGINDAPALIRADVGIASSQSAGVNRASYRKMAQNLLWATGYNIVALPLAAGVLAPVGVLLSPAVGALFMSLSTVIVAINAQFLRQVRLG